MPGIRGRRMLMARVLKRSARQVLLAMPGAPTELARGVVRCAREHDWHLVADAMVTGALRRDWKGDGVLASLPYQPELLESVAGWGIPCVEFSPAGGTGNVPRVEADHAEIGRIAADHLLERGHRRFAWAPFADDDENRERFAAFHSRLAEQGCSCRILPPAHAREGSSSPLEGPERRRLLIAELQRLPHPAAVFAFNDCVALEIVDACREAGFAVPEDVAVLGAGDSILCAASAPPLSSIDLDLEEVGYRAGLLLEKMMNGMDASARVVRVLPKGVVTRMSTDLIAVSDPRVARALTYIAEHYPEPSLSVGSVASAVGMSRRNLERSFRLETGCTIHQHVINVRMREASRLLKTSARTKTSDVAALVGLDGERTFFRVFRRHFGMSPRAHREWAAQASQAHRASSLPVPSLVSPSKSVRRPIAGVRPTAA